MDGASLVIHFFTIYSTLGHILRNVCDSKRIYKDNDICMKVKTLCYYKLLTLTVLCLHFPIASNEI